MTNRKEHIVPTFEYCISRNIMAVHTIVSCLHTYVVQYRVYNTNIDGIFILCWQLLITVVTVYAVKWFVLYTRFFL